jgi:pilus assembly protein CpaE
MSRIAQVVLIESDATMRQNLRMALSNVPYAQIIAETDNLLYGYELIRQNRPQMVFIDLRDDNSEDSLRLIERISTYFKETIICVSGQTVSLETIMKCMQAGAREFLRRPFQVEDIVAVVEKHRLALLVDSGKDQTGRVITVFSNKGGLGKTCISVNLAIALSEVTRQPVALVDLNLHQGDICTFLNIEPKQTIAQIARDISRVDAAYLESSLAVYSNSKAKVYVMADPLRIEEAEEISADHINTIITILRSTFQYVIIDTNNTYDPENITALDLADNILLLSMVNMPTIRSTKRCLGVFKQLRYDPEKVKLIVNRYLPDEEISIEDIEYVLEHPVFWKIPNNYMVVMNSINRGIPICDLDNGQALHSNILDLACRLSGVVRPQEGGKAASANPKAPKNQKTVPNPNLSQPSGKPAETKEKKSLLGGLFGKK